MQNRIIEMNAAWMLIYFVAAKLSIADLTMCAGKGSAGIRV
jgi:hypothetical protein